METFSDEQEKLSGYTCVSALDASPLLTRFDHSSQKLLPSGRVSCPLADGNNSFCAWLQVASCEAGLHVASLLC